MANCPKCNAELADGAKFCNVCGEKLETANQAPKTESNQSKDASAAAA